MRRSVPFTDEAHIARAGEEASAHKHRGRIIDELLSTADQTSSWDDLVPQALVSTHRPRAASAIKTKSGLHRTSALAQQIQLQRPAQLSWAPFNNGRGLRVSINGNFDQQLCHEWRKLLQKAEQEEVIQFEFNLQQTPSLSLSGLAMLLLFKEQQTREIALSHCNSQVEHLLQLTGMTKYFTVLRA